MKLKVLYLLTFIISFMLFVLQVFVYEYPDGNIGMVVCMILTALMVYSCVRPIQESETFKKFMKELVKFLFRF